MKLCISSAVAIMTMMISPASAASCVDDPDLKFKMGGKNRKCKWLDKTKNVDEKCEKNVKLVGVGDNKVKSLLKDLCPAACDNCPETDDDDEDLGSMSPSPTETLAPTVCADSTEFRFKNHPKKSCDWIANKKTKNRCKKKAGFGDDPEDDGLKVRDYCLATCSKFGSGCVPPSVPTNAPVVVSPVATPVATPTTVTRSPVTGVVVDGNDDYCCSLDYKECVDWCGDSRDSCLSCHNPDVAWVPRSSFESDCLPRWYDCTHSTGSNSCCEGLMCQKDNDFYSQCVPDPSYDHGGNGDSDGDGETPTKSPTLRPVATPTNAPVLPSPTPSPVLRPTNPPVSTPTNAPIPSPTNAPTRFPTRSPTRAPVSSPTNPPVSPVSSPTTNNDIDVISGKATFYGGNEAGGACGYNDLPKVSFPRGMSVAIGGDEFDDGYGCGACYEVTCESAFGNNPGCLCGSDGNNKVVVQATDNCPECSLTHFDLNREAFTHIVKDRSPAMAGTCGIISTSFKRVSCDFQSNIKIRSKSGNSGYWFGLHVDDVAGYGALMSVKLRESNRRQSSGQNAFDIVCDKSEGPSFWICHRPNNRQIFADLDVQLTDSAGRVLSSNNVIRNLQGNQEWDFGKNYSPIDDNDTSPVSSPVSSPTIAPVSSPVMIPTNSPVSSPVDNNSGNGCCSMDYKSCVDYCGTTQGQCDSCQTGATVVWLSNGPPSSQCTERWGGCDGNPNGCCDGLSCQWRDGYGYNACLPRLDPTPAPVPAPPTSKPTNAPTLPPVPTVSPAPTAESKLLSTDRAMDNWQIFLGLESVTYQNSPTNYALVASGGAAGDGNYVVSESQAYGLLITGTILASWNTHGTGDEADRAKVLRYFEGYFNFWKQMCAGSNINSACQVGGQYCKDFNTGDSHICLPDWKVLKTGGSVGTGPAPDADEDAIVGIMLAVKAVENDRNKPSWYDEARVWADASATAFYEFEVDKSKPDHRLVKLGACWGGWNGDGNNPSYHSPGSFRVMKDYQKSFPNSLRQGYNAVSQDNWQKLIDTSHEVLLAVQCSDDGALVPNWATIGVDNAGNIKHTGGGFSGSGTPQYEYGAEAARTTFRVALDAAFYPDLNPNPWSEYLSAFHERLSDGFNGSGFSETGTFRSCRGPNTNQNIQMFGNWKNNEFISGPTLSALIAAPPNSESDSMIDAAGDILSKQPLPASYYPRLWTLISNLMLNGAMESAGNTLKQ